MTHGTPGRSSCPTGKHRYHDRIAALLALANAQGSRSARRQEMRVYECPRCHGWHLTSRAVYTPPRVTPKPRRRYERPRLQHPPDGK